MATLPGLRPTSLHPRWLLLAPVLLACWLFRVELGRAVTQSPGSPGPAEQALRCLEDGLPSLADIYAAQALEEDPENPTALRAGAEVDLDFFNRQPEKAAHRLPFALERALYAVELAPEWAAAHRTLARAATELGLLRLAGNEWQAVLRLEPNGEFSDEARAGLAASGRALRRQAADTDALWRSELERAEAGSSPDGVRRLVQADPQEARRQVEEVLIGDWANAVLAGRKAAAGNALGHALAVSDVLAMAVGDPLPQLVVQGLAEAAGQERRRLAAAHRFHAQISADKAGATELYDQAARAFSEAGSSFVHWATLNAAVADYHANRYPSALARLSPLVELAAARGYPNLEARARWIRGLVWMVGGELRRALADYEAALGLYGRTGERGYQSYLGHMVAKDLRWLGAKEEAWRFRPEALRGLPAIRRADRRFSVLKETSDALAFEGRDRAALVVLEEQLRVSRAAVAGDPGLADLLVWTLVDRAKIHRRRNDLEAARRDLDEARAAISVLPNDSELKPWAGQAVTLAAAELHGDPSSRIASANALIAVLKGEEGSGKDAIVVLTARRSRAAAERDAGQLDAAVATLEAALKDVERLLGSVGITAFDDRARLRAEYGELVTELVSLEWIERKQPAAALERLERARNRTLLEEVAWWQGHGEPRVLSLAEIQAALPADRALVGYVSLRPGAGLGLWTLTRDRLEFETRSLERLEVEQWAARVRLEKQEAELPEGASEQGARELLPAALATLPTGTRLTVLPSPELYDVPWAALVAASDGLTVSDVTVTPSATFFVTGGGRAEVPRPRPIERVLIIAATVFDEQTFPALATLPELPAQAERLRDQFPGVTLLAGEAATPSAVLVALAEHEVVYFLGHALSPVTGDRIGGLVLAPELAGPYSTGLLPPQAITRQQLGHLKRVLLDACETGRGTRPGGQEMASLATAFLAAGAQTVKASLIPVLDSATRVLDTKKTTEGPSNEESKREQYIWQTYSVLREGDGW